ncbi:MAG: ArnT family glycosyltransferase [Planctomycetaceae bacterium]
MPTAPVFVFGKPVAILAGIIAALVVVRLPVIYRQPGGHDEEYYAFPGLTVLESGIPRMPHVPQRDPSRVFYRADEAFFAEPPLYFYVQAMFYAVLPDVYGTARLASLTAGVFAILLVYVLARRWYRDETIALWAAGLYSLSRMFYFPAITARPDLMCTLLGLVAVYAFDRWREARRRKWFVATGVLIGLGGLTHPFAIVYAVQLAGWSCWSERRWQRISMPLVLAVVAVATCALWLPLILAYPDEFRAQFGNNVLHPAGPGLLSRFLSPWGALARQTEVTWERAAPIQFCLFAAGVIAAAVLDGRRRDGGQTPVLIAVSAIYLISLIIGQHPGYGYWSYAAAFFAMCLSSVLIQACRRVMGPVASRGWIGLPPAVFALLLMAPGLGLRTSWAYATHWHDIDYNAPRFAARILDDLPQDARYTVGIEYALDFYAAGRTTLIGETYDYYLESKDFPYDYLVVSHDGLEWSLPELMRGRLLRTYGRRDDPFACYAEVYVPAGSTE